MSQSKDNPPRRINWTTQQSRAIAEHGRNVFVSASAGTGKTAVLSGSCVNVVTNPSACPDIWGVLVVTFTEMAAEEMRSRIAKQLRSEMETAADAALRRHLRHQLILLGAADISTIHSFCKRIITEHFYEIGLDPTFGIIDADEAKLLKTEILEKTIDWAWKQNNIADALRQLMTRRDLRMMEGFPATIIEISNFLDGVVSRDNWLERTKVLAEATDPFSTDIAQAQKQIITEKLENIVSQIRYAEKIYSDAAGSENAKFENLYIEPITKLLKILKDGNWARFNELIRNYRKPRVETPKGIDEEFAGFIQKTIKKAVDSVQDINDLAVLNPEYLNKFAGAIGTQTRVLVELVRRFDELYRQAKKAINRLDFADLEHYALRLLTDEKFKPSQTALKLRKKYKYIFVDEYQDINDVQQAIIDMVGSPGNVFAVGDPKQSIYHWRGAKPEIFIAHLGKASVEPKSSGAGLRVDLNVNFRSVKPILDFANRVFGRIMTASFAGIDYDESAHLKPHSQDTAKTERSPAVELHILDEAQDNSDSSPFSDRQLQAAMIAQRIKQLVGADSDERIIDKEIKKTRPVEYHDIVVLMRSLAGKSDFIESLRLAGIPVSCDAAAGYFEATEITDMLCLLKILDNPRRDIEFAATLRCPFFRFSDTELAQIRLHGKDNRDVSFYDCAMSLCKSGGELANKLTNTIATLDEWRTVARRGRLAELIWHIYRQTGYLSFVCALPDGPARRANLLKLHDRAIQFEGFAGNSGVPSLTRFIVFLEKLIAAGEDWSKPQPEAGTGNTVRVMSIHKSKGLEFPVVFVADLDSGFSKKDFSRDCVLDERLTLGLKIIDTENNSRLDSLAYQVIEEQNRRKSLAEEMRIFYVAMTRAMNRLILVGCKDRDSCKNTIIAAHSFAGQSIPSWHLETYQNHLDWILSALGSEQILHKEFQTGLPTQTSQDNLFSVQFYDQPELEKLSVLLQSSKHGKIINNKSSIMNLKNIAKLKETLNWQYPYGDAPSLPAKRTVTQWTHRNDEFTKIDYSLAFDRKPKAAFATKQIDGREIGTATHLVMSKLDLTKPVTTEVISRLINNLIKGEAVTESVASQVNADSIVKFFKSKLGQIVLDKNNSFLREWPFTFAVPASQWKSDNLGEILNTKYEIQDKIIVQGIIDLLVKIPEGLVIIDFKTDDVSADGATKRATIYRGQLNLYAQAAGIILGRKIKSKWLCFLRPGCEVEV
ncbi:MAG: helicase-exonuclease AddAB subunit AddA [Sedimentisphaerales bacterium]|jgi:ATP-dependent helicase/nuclease subunit A